MTPTSCSSPMMAQARIQVARAQARVREAEEEENASPSKREAAKWLLKHYFDHEALAFLGEGDYARGGPGSL